MKSEFRSSQPKKQIELLLIISFLFPCCSTTYQVAAVEGPDQITYSQFNSLASDKTSIIEFVDKSSLNAFAFRIGPDSASWGREDGDRVVVPSSQVKLVTFLNRGLGFLEGLGWGALTGLGAGVAWGVLIETGKTSKSEGGLAVILSAVLFTSGGIPIGGIAGVIAGHRDHYVFIP